MSRHLKRFWKRFAALLLIAALALAAIYAYEARRYPLTYRELAHESIEGTLVPLALLMAVIRTESSFNPNAVSSAGARGLTQIMPETFEWLQSRTGENLPVEALFEPGISIRYGALLLDILLAEFGVAETALAAYHAGRTRVNNWLRDPEISPDGRTIPHIPTPQTRHYVNKVMRAYEKYQRILG